MRFSIDMVWISATKNIVYMAQENISPSTYPEDFIPTSACALHIKLRDISKIINSRWEMDDIR